MSVGKSSGAPTVSHCTSGRSKSAEPAAKPSAGSRNAEAATAPAPCAVSVMNRRRVTVSPSKAPGICRSAVYLDFGVLRGSDTNGVSGRERRRTISPGGRARDPTGRRATPPWRPRAPVWSHGRPRRRPPPTPRRPEPGRPRRGIGHTARSGRRARPPRRASPSSARRASPSAYRRSPASSARSGSLGGADHAALAVVLQVALADRLDQQRVLARPAAASAVGAGASAGIGHDLGASGRPPARSVAAQRRRARFTRSPRTRRRRPRPSA